MDNAAKGTKGDTASDKILAKTTMIQWVMLPNGRMGATAQKHKRITVQQHIG